MKKLDKNAPSRVSGMGGDDGLNLLRMTSNVEVESASKKL